MGVSSRQTLEVWKTIVDPSEDRMSRLIMRPAGFFARDEEAELRRV